MNLTPDEVRLRDAIRAGNHDQAQQIGAQLDAEQREHDARLEAPGALLAAALWYAAAGLPVFPCEPRGKRPLPGSRGYKDATTDPDRIQTWWNRTPHANLAAPTGVHFDAIDIDGPTGLASILPILDRLPPLLGKARTGRPGGWHYLVPPATRPNKAGLLPGVDYRGHGGYIILPPSIGPAGNRYRWVQAPTLGGQQQAGAA